MFIFNKMTNHFFLIYQQQGFRSLSKEFQIKKMKKGILKTQQWDGPKSYPTKLGQAHQVQRSANQYKNQQGQSPEGHDPALKVSFYHKNYLLPFKLLIPQKAILSSVVDYKQLQAKFDQALKKELIFSTSQQKSLVNWIDIRYLQSFMNILEQEKRLRLKMDCLGYNFLENLNALIGNFNQSEKQIMQGQHDDISFKIILDNLSLSEYDAKSLANKVKKFVFNKVKTIIGQNNRLKFNPKELLSKLKFIWLRYLQSGPSQQYQTDSSQEIQLTKLYKQYFLLVLALLKLYYKQMDKLHQVHKDAHSWFLFSFLVIQTLLKLMTQISKYCSKGNQSIMLCEIVIDLTNCFIKDSIFLWINFHKFPFCNQNIKNQSFYDGQTNFSIYKASILTKLIELIHFSLTMKRLINYIGIKKEQGKQQKTLGEQEKKIEEEGSLISWLLDSEEFKEKQKKPNFVSFIKQSSLNSGCQEFYQEVSILHQNHQQVSVLEHLINQVYPENKTKQQRCMVKRRTQYKNAYFFPNYHITTNLHYISSFMGLNKAILEKYIKQISEDFSESQSSITNSKKKITNQFLWFVTETLRYQFPQHIKKVQQNIKERKYKMIDSVIVKEVNANLTGTIATYINESLISQMMNSKSHILSETINSPHTQIPYFKLKELLHIFKPTQNEFLSLCKALLKDLKQLSKEYHNFKSGKIIVDKKQIQNLSQKDLMLRDKFILKNKLIKQNQVQNNFNELQHLNYDTQKSPLAKNTVDMGVNVNLIYQARSHKEKIIDYIEPSIQILKQKFHYHSQTITQPKNDHQNRQDSNHIFFKQKQTQTSIAADPNSMTLRLPQQRSKMRELSQSIDQPLNLLNHNNEILKLKDQKIIRLFKQNEELIKVNTWYEEQLRLRQDKEEKLETMIAQLMSFNELKEQKLQKKRRQLGFSQCVLKEKIVPDKGVKFSAPYLEDHIFRSSIGSNRMSKDSGTRSREKSIVHQRLIQDLNKLSSPPGEKSGNGYILPPLPPPPIIGQPPQASTGQLVPRPPVPPLDLVPPLLISPPPLMIEPPPLLTNPPSLENQPFFINTIHPSKNEEKQPKKEMKNLGWTMVDVRTVPSSFWQNVGEVQLDEQDLIVNFSKTSQTIVPQLVATKQKQTQIKSLLKPDRVKNIQIGLRKTKLKTQNMNNLQEILYRYDQNLFDQQIIDCLLSILPSSKDKQNFLSLFIPQQSIHQWTPADYFIYRIVRIQAYEERLKAIQFKDQFHQIHLELMRKINVFIEFFEEFRMDEFMHSFLTHLLAVGNFLNAKSHKANAYGFRLQSIPKTYTLIGQDHETSLFDYVLKMISNKNQDLFVKYSSYKYFQPQTTKMLTSLNIIEDDFSTLTKEIQNVQEIIIYSNQSEDNSSKYLLLFYIKAQEDMNVVKKMISQAKRVFEQVTEFYCQKMSSQELIGFVIEFRKRVKEFMRVNFKKKGNQQQQSRLTWSMSQRYSIYQ